MPYSRAIAAACLGTGGNPIGAFIAHPQIQKLLSVGARVADEAGLLPGLMM